MRKVQVGIQAFQLLQPFQIDPGSIAVELPRHMYVGLVLWDNQGVSVVWLLTQTPRVWIRIEITNTTRIVNPPRHG